MKENKLLIIPTFQSIPQSTAANVEENIIHWIKKGDVDKLNTFCRPCTRSKTGYRFINSDDLIEIITTQQTIQGIDFNIRWTRTLHTTDHFCPLWFSERYLKCILFHKDISFEFKSDNHLKKKIKEIKQANIISYHVTKEFK